EPPAAGQPLLRDVLLDDATTPAATDLQQRAIAALHTITTATAKLALDAPTLGWLLTNAPTLGWLELDHRPYGPGTPATGYPAWEKLASFLTLAATCPDVTNPADATTPFTARGFFDTVLTGTAADVLSYLATLTG